jgi:hypothetical protein
MQNPSFDEAIALIEQNPQLVLELESAPDLDSTQAVLQRAGIDLSVGDLLEYYISKRAVELAEPELEGVTGGCCLWTCIFTSITRLNEV